MTKRNRIDKSALFFGIPKRIRDRAHLDWVRDLPCAVSRKPGPSDPAHISVGNRPGKGLKAGDDHVLPLSHFEHMRQHRVGEVSFYGDDLPRAQQLALDLYAVSGDTLAAMKLLRGFWQGA